MALAPRPASPSKKTAAEPRCGRVTIIKSEVPLARYHEVQTLEGGTRTPSVNEALGLSPSPRKRGSGQKRPTREERIAAFLAEHWNRR